MTFVFALSFVLTVLIASYWHGWNMFMAVLVGLAMGAWLTALIDKRIRRITEENSPLKKPAEKDGIYAALQDIHWRLKRLEETQKLGASPMEANQTTKQEEVAAIDTAALDMSIDDALVGRRISATEAGLIAKEEAVAAAAAKSAVNRAPRPAVSASTPPGDDVVGKALQQARDWLMGGNTVVRVGIIILFFGVAFLLKFAAEHAVLPLELRVAGIGAGAVALLVLGWRLRQKREGYALALQGAGVGLLYLTLFGAFRLYSMVPPSMALTAMVMVSGLSALLAILQNSRGLITMGVTGGFLAPILASTGSGNHVALFSYYAVLNLGIFGVAWFKAWRPLNLLGFFFTFSIGMLWGAKAYQPELFSSTEPFLLLFFAMFLTISILFAQRQSHELGKWLENASGVELGIPPRIVDSTLVFGLPLVAFGFQAALVKGMPFALAYSALTLSALYLGLARWLQNSDVPTLRLLKESFLALGVIFATLAIPLALDARWTSASWALEGAALVWVGLRQQRRIARAFGLLLQLAAAVAYFHQDALWSAVDLPLLNASCLGATLIAVAALFSAWRLRVSPDASPWEKTASLAFFLWGLGWWLLAGLGEADRLLDALPRNSVALVFLALTALAFSALQRRLDWDHARLPAMGLLMGLLLVFFSTATHNVFSYTHPFTAYGWLAWPVALVLHAWLLHRHDKESPRWFAGVHACTLWLLAALGAWEMAWVASNANLPSAWAAAAWILPPALLLFVVCKEKWLARWPLQDFAPSYIGWGAVPLVLTLAAWCLLTDLSQNGDAHPLPYLPLLNPVDLGHLLCALVAVRWGLQLRVHGKRAHFDLSPRPWLAALAALTFFWLNAVLLRSLHHWADIPYTLDDMLGSVLVQAALSLFWSLIALALMLLGTRRVERTLWMLGAGLMAVVVGKLFIVDLGGIGSVARIVSFIGVGLLMLVIGYVAPVPPKAGTVKNEGRSLNEETTGKEES